MSGGYDYTYRKRYNHDRAQGITRTTPADPIRAHIQKLRDHGWSWHDIGRAAGIGLTTAHDITTSGRPRVRTATANRILAIRPDAGRSTGFVPAIGTRRRITALLALGWTHAELRTRSGITTRDVVNQPGEWVAGSTRDAIAELYNELSMRRGPSAKTRGRARSLGYLPPLAYDDETLDDPSPKVDAIARRNAAETAA